MIRVNKFTFLPKPESATHYALANFLCWGVITHACVFIIPVATLMVKKVKLPEDNMVLGRDEVEEYDDLSMDGTSQGEGTKASEDASDYEDDPKGAPGRLHFGDDRCRKVFQLTKDVEEGIARVCGGPIDCSRKGHKRTTDQGKPGIYDTIKTLHYVDGILGTHRT